MKKNTNNPQHSSFVIKDSKAADWVDKQTIMQMFPISRRALQVYRTKKLIPFAKLGGKVFYYIPGIVKALEASANRQRVRR